MESDQAVGDYWVAVGCSWGIRRESPRKMLDAFHGLGFHPYEQIAYPGLRGLFEHDQCVLSSSVTENIGLDINETSKISHAVRKGAYS